MDELYRPDWDDYFMALTFTVAMRSLDPRTKCGCIIVDEKHRVLSIGYNSPPRGSDDANIPTQPPEKYFYFEHAERNAIYNCNSSMEGATAYVTGPPCFNCLRGLIQKGIKKLVLGPNIAVMSSENDDAQKAAKRMTAESGIEVVNMENLEFLGIFSRVFKYMQSKGMDVESQMKKYDIAVPHISSNS